MFALEPQNIGLTITELSAVYVERIKNAQPFVECCDEVAQNQVVECKFPVPLNFDNLSRLELTCACINLDGQIDENYLIQSGKNRKDKTNGLLHSRIENNFVCALVKFKYRKSEQEKQQQQQQHNDHKPTFVLFVLIAGKPDEATTPPPYVQWVRIRSRSCLGQVNGKLNVDGKVYLPLLRKQLSDRTAKSEICQTLLNIFLQQFAKELSVDASVAVPIPELNSPAHIREAEVDRYTVSYYLFFIFFFF
jgi:hypothetical protein